MATNSLIFATEKTDAMSKTILERMCAIAEKMRESEGCEEMPVANMDRARADIRSLAKVLEMTPMQAVILTAIVRKSSRYHINGDDVASMLGMEYLKFLTYDKEMSGLRKRGYILVDSDGDIVLPKQVKNSLKSNKPVKPAPTTGLDAFALLSRIKQVLSILDEDQLTTEEAVDELNGLMELNLDNSVSRGIRNCLAVLPDIEVIVLYALVYRFYSEDDDYVGWHNIDDYVTDDTLNRLRGWYRQERMVMQTRHIIEYAGQDGLIDKDYFRLTDEVKEEILSDTGWTKQKAKGKPTTVNASRKLEAAAIGPKELIYNEAEGRQIKRLKELLSQDRFDDIRAKLKEKGLRSGFTCLFFGSPGTGKTETVYQVARESGRDIFMVDVSQIKSCWVGESEKNIKDVFVKYRRCVSEGGTVPILLFNEADAIFGIRSEGAGRAVDKMENSIQNIILQEMEDLDGILIATTNLTCNMDKAFERRFLYKVRFDKPSVEAKLAIWRSMMPALSMEEAATLAAEFDFSGGQIENVVRKREVQALICLEEPTFEDVRSFCQEETIGNGLSGRRKIGF